MKFSSLSIKTQILVSISAPLVLLLIVGGWTVLNNNSTLETNRLVNYTNEIIADSAALTLEAVNMETGLRGYQLAGEEIFLEPYRSGEERVFKQLADLKEVIITPAQRAKLDEAESILREWVSEVAESNIQLRRDISESRSMNDMAILVATGGGKDMFDQFRIQIQRLQEDTDARLQQARGNVDSAVQSSASGAETLQEATDDLSLSQEADHMVHLLLTEAVNMETGVRGFLLTGNESFLQPFRDGEDAFFRNQQILEELLKDKPDQVEMLDEVTVVVREWLVSHIEPAVDLRRQISAGMDMEDMAESVSQAIGKTYFDQFRKLMQDFNVAELELLVERSAANEESTNASTMAVIVSAALAALMLPVGFLVARNISQPLSETIGVISTTTTQLASTTDEHERTASAQAAAIKQTVTTAAELSSTAHQSTEQAEIAVSAAGQALQVAAEGQRLIDETMQGMGEIKEKSNSISEQILSLSEQTGQISAINRLVTDIAAETKMLALNASVEATHAGEQGKGFAVVASEIRKLADQSKKSAERINALVEGIQKATNTTIMAAEEGSKTIEKGSDLAHEVSSAFTGIVDAINSSYENMQQIALSSKQQSDATAQIAKVMTSIEAGASETMTGLGQTRNGLHNLDETAKKLKQKT